MKHRITATVLAVTLSLPLLARADGVDCNWPDLVKETKANQAAADKAEAAGKLFDAYLYYSNGLGCLPDGGQAGLKRIGRLLGQAAEKAGRKYGSEGTTAETPDPACKKYHDAMMNAGEGSSVPKEPSPPGSCSGSGKRLVASQRASAVEWYEQTRNFADSDRVMADVAKAAPDDIDVFKLAFQHFGNRQASGDYDGAYKTDPRYEAELKAQAAKNAAAIFATEEKEWALKEVNISGDPAQRSLAILHRARAWAEFYQDAVVKKANDRAVQRGDELAKNPSVPQNLQSAIAYYRFAGADGKVPAVQKTAEKRGDELMAAGKVMDAGTYYGISGNQAKMQSATKQIEKEAGKMVDDARKSIKDLKKSDEEKSKFRKEQDNLEKELGF